MIDIFKEIYFCNSEEELNEIISILRTSKIDFSVNKKDSTDDFDSYKYSISVPEKSVDFAFDLLSKIETNISDSINQKEEIISEKKIPARNIIALIVTALCAVLFINIYKISEKTYSSIKNKKVNKEYSVGKKIPVESARETTDTENIEKTEKLKITEKHGIKTYNTAQEIPLPSNIEIHSIINTCYDDYDTDFQQGKPIERTDIFYEDDCLKIQVTPEDFIQYGPFIVKVSVLKKEFSKELYDERDSYEQNKQFGSKYNVLFCNSYYEEAVLNYSVKLVSKEKDICLLERLFTIAPSNRIVIFSEEEDKKANRMNPFAYSRSTINTNEKFVLYFSKINRETGNTNDSVIFSNQTYVYDGSYVQNIPFANYKVLTSINNMNRFVFSIENQMTFHIDFYSEENAIIDYNHILDFNYTVYEDKSNNKYEPFKEIKWIVNTPEGLNIRSRPYGIKIGGVVNKTELIQTGKTESCYDDIIDGIHGYWIPIKVPENKLKRINTEGIEIYGINKNETTGWVFSGYCKQVE